MKNTFLSLLALTSICVAAEPLSVPLDINITREFAEVKTNTVTFSSVQVREVHIDYTSKRVMVGLTTAATHSTFYVMNTNAAVFEAFVDGNITKGIRQNLTKMRVVNKAAFYTAK